MSAPTSYIARSTLAFLHYIDDNPDRLGDSLHNDIDWAAITYAAGRGCDCDMKLMSRVIPNYTQSVNL